MKRDDFNILTRPDIKVVFKQQVTPDTRLSLNALKEQLKLDEVPVGLSGKISSVYVEMMNNMRMHAAPRKEATAALGIFLLGEDKKLYYLQGSNAVASDKVDTIQIQLERMNTHIKDELRKFFKYRRRQDNPNKESEGAGLGIIEIAKRTTHPIEFSFKELGEGITFFTMLVKIDKEG